MAYTQGGQTQVFTKPHQEIRYYSSIATVGLSLEALIPANVAITVFNGGNYRQGRDRQLVPLPAIT
jgi:hypothetical protein